MAYATINFENPQTGAIKQAPVGFSWTVLFFGFFPALFRAHIVGALIMFCAFIFTMGLSNLIFMFIYNKMFIKYLIGEGFKVREATQDPELLANKLKVALPVLVEAA
ncbi:MAG: hypothetical protein ABJN40_12395 [Sneathiella sp.]